MAESGHVVNVNNLKKGRDFATGWAGNYPPSNPDLDPTAMSLLITIEKTVELR